MGSKHDDLTGMQFGKLKVLKYAGTSKNQKSLWECLCECGKTKIIIGSNLKNGSSSSCGCLHKKQLSNLRKKHGRAGSRIYKTWIGMKNRCHNPNGKDYKDYGLRGIKVCDEWENNFESFLIWAENNGYNDLLTIERVNVNKGYEPSNCKWIPMSKQSANRRTNNYITINGKTKTVSEWSNVSGIPRNTIYRRLNRGITGKKLLYKGRIN